MNNNFINETDSINVCVDDRLMTILWRRDHSQIQYKVLTDIVSIDILDNSPKRFKVVYNRLSFRYAKRIIVVVWVNDNESLPSVYHLYKSANWLERELWDIIGIGFYNHPDRRRILTDYGIEGHPRRKDYPLGGYTEVQYSDRNKRVVLQQVSYAQDTRLSDRTILQYK